MNEPAQAVWNYGEAMLDCCYDEELNDETVQAVRMARLPVKKANSKK